MKKVFFIYLLLLAGPVCAAAAPHHHSKAITVFSDVLYWQLREGGAENWAQVITPTSANRTATLVGTPFKWNTGYRVGAGYTKPASRWDSLLYYTHYQTRGLNGASDYVYSAFLGNFFANNTNGASIIGAPTYRFASMNWTYNYDTVDFEIGRNFKIDRRLLLRPYLGLKYAVIDQHMYTSWHVPVLEVPFNNALENLKQDFSGVGPVFGLKATFPLYQRKRNSLSLMGNLSCGLLYGHWSFSDVFQSDQPSSITVTVNSVNGLETMARGLLGLEWTTTFSKADISAHLAYEAQAWINQMRFYSYNMGRLNAQMSLQGGVFGLSVNF